MLVCDRDEEHRKNGDGCQILLSEGREFSVCFCIVADESLFDLEMLLEDLQALNIAVRVENAEIRLGRILCSDRILWLFFTGQDDKAAIQFSPARQLFEHVSQVGIDVERTSYRVAYAVKQIVLIAQKFRIGFCFLIIRRFDLFFRFVFVQLFGCFFQPLRIIVEQLKLRR